MRSTQRKDIATVIIILVIILATVMRHGRVAATVIPELVF